MAMRCDGQPSGSEHELSRRKCSRTPAARAGPIAASLRFSASCRFFTQGAAGYDVLVAADESEVFAAYLPYRTWDPRPVAGSSGLIPTTWDASHDQWGAVQLQNRFKKMFGRRMTARDMQAWSAVRMIGEAASRTRSFDPRTLLDFLRGPDFALAAFK